MGFRCCCHFPIRFGLWVMDTHTQWGHRIGVSQLGKHLWHLGVQPLSSSPWHIQWFLEHLQGQWLHHVPASPFRCLINISVSKSILVQLNLSWSSFPGRRGTGRLCRTQSGFAFPRGVHGNGNQQLKTPEGPKCLKETDLKEITTH